MDRPDRENQSGFQPFVPVDTALPELTFKAVALGAVMAIILGAANAYLGMRAGLTVAATFPAAVVAMAALRGLGGSVLEENIARTTASVGEALVAGAIFTIPAFVISGVWDEIHYWESTAIMVVGGTLGVLFIIILRRTLVVEADLPFPESVAAAGAGEGRSRWANRGHLCLPGDGARGRLGVHQEQQWCPDRVVLSQRLRVAWAIHDRAGGSVDQLRPVGSCCNRRLHRQPCSASGSSSGRASGRRSFRARCSGGCSSSRSASFSILRS